MWSCVVGFIDCIQPRALKWRPSRVHRSVMVYDVCSIVNFFFVILKIVLSLQTFDLIEVF